MLTWLKNKSGWVSSSGPCYEMRDVITSHFKSGSSYCRYHHTHTKQQPLRWWTGGCCHLSLSHTLWHTHSEESTHTYTHIHTRLHTHIRRSQHKHKTSFSVYIFLGPALCKHIIEEKKLQRISVSLMITFRVTSSQKSLFLFVCFIYWIRNFSQ